jgi:hypothetical protein
MTKDEYRRRLRFMERWANDQVARIEYQMARPPAYDKDPAAYEAHMERCPARESEITLVERILHDCSESLDADFYGIERPAIHDSAVKCAQAYFDSVFEETAHGMVS